MANARLAFWDHIVDALRVVDHFCVEGNFNMIEASFDHVGGSYFTVQGPELAAWQSLCMTGD